MMLPVTDPGNRPIWPRDIVHEWQRRYKIMSRMKTDMDFRYAANVHYQNNPADWINDFCITYNPRNQKPLTRTMPFNLFPKQEDFVQFLWECVQDGENGLVEKCRDIGATWLCAAFSVWLWLYHEGSAVGWGSRKEDLVDTIGDPDSIFEKIRMIVKNLPRFMRPAGFNPKVDSTYMKLLNRANGSTITGEAGDNIGRGGRKTIYIKDESAHYARPELIEAALGDNTDVQIDISSVNGTGNVFYRRREAGIVWYPGLKIAPGFTRVFIFDWRDHPLKTQEWYEQRRARNEREGLLHIFAQEVDRDYAAAVKGVIIPAKWVNAAIDAHIRLNIPVEGERQACLDVADEGTDSNALGARIGIVLGHADKWAFAEDVGESTRKSVQFCRLASIKEFSYDSIGMGAAVKAEVNRLRADGELPDYLKVNPWNASSSPLNAEEHLIPWDIESPIIGEIFLNLKSQGWFYLRQRFEKTYKAVIHGAVYPPEELISIDSTIEYLEELKKELSQPVWKPQTTTGKMQVDKKPDGSRSPNLADMVMMLYHPTREVSIFDVL